MSVAVAGLAASGLLNFVIVLIVGGIVAAIAYWILSMFLPHPVPVLVAVLILLLTLVYALSAL